MDREVVDCALAIDQMIDVVRVANDRRPAGVKMSLAEIADTAFVERRHGAEHVLSGLKAVCEADPAS